MIKPMHEYSRTDLERDHVKFRTELSELKTELVELQFRHQQSILDTARCASLTATVESIHDLLRRKKGGAKELAAAALGDGE